CFSVQPGVKTPPSLRNIYKEMKEELGHPVPDNGYLLPWAQQGVLLLNAVLTVREGEANSHKGKGWEKVTDAVIRAVAARRDQGGAVLRPPVRLPRTPRGGFPRRLASGEGHGGERARGECGGGGAAGTGAPGRRAHPDRPGDHAAPGR